MYTLAYIENIYFQKIYLIQMLNVSLRIYIYITNGGEEKFVACVKKKNFQKNKRKKEKTQMGETRQIVQKIISGQSVCLIH